MDGEFNDYTFKLSDGNWYLLKRWVPTEAGNYHAVFLCYIRGGEVPPVPDIAELDFRILVSPPEVHSWRMFCQGKRYRAWRVAAFNLQELIQIDSNVLDYVETFRSSVNPYKELADDVILSFDYPFYDSKFDDYHCYSQDTEVLTKDGWKLFKDVKEDDEVATLNTKGELEYQSPTALHEYDYDGYLVRIYHSGVDLLVTPNHNVLVQRYRDKWSKDPKWHFERADRLFSGLWRMRKTTAWSGIEVKEWVVPGYELHYRCGWHHKSGRVSKRPDKVFPIELWLKFLGYYISEGHVWQNRYITISQSPSSKYFDDIILTLKEMGYEPTVAAHHITICDAQLARYLSDNFGTGCRNKHLSKEIKNLSPHLLQTLFSTMVNGDGHRRGKMWLYTTTSKRLADDVQEVLLKMGYCGHIHAHKGLFIIRRIITKHAHIKPRHLLKERYRGKVYCLTVPNSTLYVRRKGIPIWSGNSYQAFRSDEFKFSRTFYDYFQTASETLLTRVGDCEDGAILYTTCARALGLHADRVYTALGLVKDESGNVLGGHAWSLVKWDDYWRLIETTLSEPYNYDLLIVGQTVEDIKKLFKYKTIIYQPLGLFNDASVIDINLSTILLPTFPFKFENGVFKMAAAKRKRKGEMAKFEAIAQAFEAETKPTRRKRQKQP
jgi:hypothetical protein